MKKSSHPHRVEIRLRNLNQLFNSMDPSPFHEKDLDDDAEEFITSWVQEFPVASPVRLVVHLDSEPDLPNAKAMAEESIHHYFAYRARLAKLELNRLLKQGQMSLLIGLSFLALCLFAVESISLSALGTDLRMLQESLTIVGWVAMWRPLETYLYDWWPVRRRQRVFQKMSRMPVELKVQTVPTIQPATT